MAVDVNDQEIEFYQGEDVPILLNPVDADVDASGWDWAFTAGLHNEDPAIELTLGDGISVSGDNSETIRVFLPRATTKNLDVRSYKFDLWRVDAGYNQRKAGGVLKVMRPKYPTTN